MEKGDYVIATKFDDGDIHDHWCVGIYDHLMDQYDPPRHHIVDGCGNPFRNNGFRRCEKIESAVGEKLVEMMPLIDTYSDGCVWDILENVRSQF